MTVSRSSRLAPLPIRSLTPPPVLVDPLMASACAAAFEAPTLSDREFVLLRGLIEREAGIHLSSAKKALVVSRLSRRLRALSLPSFGAYFELVSGPEGASELVAMLDAISTNETSFFRERKHFEFLEHQVLPGWRQEAVDGKRSRHVRVWSAGCSTGEEPYSLAMVLLMHLPPSAGWQVDILATDLSTRVLDRARAGTWPIEKAESIPGEYRRAFMLRGVGTMDGTMKAGPEVRKVVRFARLNLHAASYALPRDYDLVFCRNVLIYFDQEARANITGRLISHLHPEGYLFLGHAETLHTASPSGLVTIIPTVFGRRKPETDDARWRRI
jgi:chemotaxis protein methyltransferase CheR